MAEKIKMQCPAPECTFQTAEAEASVVAVLLSIHASTVHTPQATASVSTPRGPKLDRPRVDSGIDEETWNAFIRRWDAFRLGSGITIGEAPRQLFHCASDALGDLILKSDPSITTRSLEEVRQLMKSLAVIPVSIGVIRAELSKMSQDADEQFRTFAAKVRGKAETCAFSTCVKCSCGLDIIADYTNEVIIDVLLAGIYDTDIRLEALSDRGLMKKTVNDVITFVESREMARNAIPSPALSAISSFKRNSKPQLANSLTQSLQTQQADASSQKEPSAADKGKTGSCAECGVAFKIFTQNARGWNKKPHKLCKDCWKLKNQRPRNGNLPAESNAVAEEFSVSQISAMSADTTIQASGVNVTQSPSQSRIHLQKTSGPQVVALHHHIFQKGEWRRAQLRAHPQVTITVSMDHTKHSHKRSTPHGLKAKVDAIADSGAQSNLWSLKEYIKAGFARKDLLPVTRPLKAANSSRITIAGAFFATISGRASDGKRIVCHTMIYVSEMANGLYLSYDTMLDLGILGNNFPSIGNAWHTTLAVSAPRFKLCSGARTIHVPTQDLHTSREGALHSQEAEILNKSTPSDEAIRASNCGCSATSQQ